MKKLIINNQELIVIGVACAVLFVGAFAIAVTQNVHTIYVYAK